MVQPLPSESPVWGTDPGATLEPTLSEKQAGWSPAIRPPARWQNWYQHNAYQHLDLLHESLLKAWKPSGPVFAPGPGLDHEKVVQLGFHNGQYLAGTNRSGSPTLHRSLDGRVWVLTNGSLSTSYNTDGDGGLASDGARLVQGGAVGTYFSDNNGVSWTLGTGPTGQSRAYYLEQAALWVGSEATAFGSAMQSADGQTWVAVASSDEINVGGGSTICQRAAENADGSIVMLADRFSTNQGGSWAAQSNIPANFPSFWFSHLRGDFITANNEMAAPLALYDTTAAGVWNTVPFTTIPNANRLRYFFEMRGTMFAAVNRVIAGQSVNVLSLSRDLGVTWEDAAGPGGFSQVNHYSGTADGGHALMMGSVNANSEVYSTDFAGHTTTP